MPAVITRFAPSPTGPLHLGGARTALFNRLFARHEGGRFRLRIEDTDRLRSTPEARESILSGLRWLGLDWDGDLVVQSERRERHREAAQLLLDSGHAYHCWCTPEELEEIRRQARAEGRSPRYDGRCRDRPAGGARAGHAPALRLKAPQSGETCLDDLVQGRVVIANSQLDDMILLRADGSPTYMLCATVDDHDMGVSHIIRGSDHLTNALRGRLIYAALDWPMPLCAHIPLIHGPDGSRLSKRHNAPGLEVCRAEGYLPEAMRNYLARLGWAHGDDEIFSDAEAVRWFSLKAVGQSPARFDPVKMKNLNGHYIRQADPARLVREAEARLAPGGGLPAALRSRLEQAMPQLKDRAKTLVELAENSRFLVSERPLALSPEARDVLTEEAREILGKALPCLERLEEWSAGEIERALRAFGEAEGIAFGRMAKPLRAALTGQMVSPGIFDVLASLGRAESLGRICDAAAG